MKFFKIDNKIATDRCKKIENRIVGSGEILYYLSEEEYEQGVEHYSQEFDFDFDTEDDSIEVSTGNLFVKDVDVDDLVDNIKANVLPCLSKNDETYTGNLLLGRVKVFGGFLEVTTSPDPSYPGVDIEFVPDNEDEIIKQNHEYQRARVLLETPQPSESDDKTEIRAYVWQWLKNKSQTEDYNHSVVVVDNISY